MTRQQGAEETTTITRERRWIAWVFLCRHRRHVLWWHHRVVIRFVAREVDVEHERDALPVACLARDSSYDGEVAGLRRTCTHTRRDCHWQGASEMHQQGQRSKQ